VSEVRFYNGPRYGWGYILEKIPILEIVIDTEVGNILINRVDDSIKLFCQSVLLISRTTPQRSAIPWSFASSLAVAEAEARHRPAVIRGGPDSSSQQQPSQRDGRDVIASRS